MAAKDGVFVVFRAFDDILDGNLFANSLTATDFHQLHLCEDGSSTSRSICHQILTADFWLVHLSRNQKLSPSSNQMLLNFPGMPNVTRAGGEDPKMESQELSFHRPHRNFIPKILQPKFLTSTNCHDVVFDQNHNSLEMVSWRTVEGKITENFQWSKIRPKRRCAVVMDAHVASCLKTEFSRSCTYRGNFLENVAHIGGFRNYRLGHKPSTSKSKNSSGDCIPVGVVMDIFIVWPWTKIDYAWSVHVLGLLTKHVVLEEGLAWLSTLGGAHSSLGEKFLYHAEKAGEISAHQMRLARDLGNEIMIARCYLYWSWSLLQRRFLHECKLCVISTWRFCHQLRCRDTVLENMCQAVWTRLKYEKSLCRLQKSGTSQKNGTNHSFNRADGVVYLR